MQQVRVQNRVSELVGHLVIIIYNYYAYMNLIGHALVYFNLSCLIISNHLIREMHRKWPVAYLLCLWSSACKNNCSPVCRHDALSLSPRLSIPNRVQSFTGS